MTKIKFRISWLTTALHSGFHFSALFKLLFIIVPVRAFDLNNTSRIDFVDIVMLFNEVYNENQ